MSPWTTEKTKDKEVIVQIRLPDPTGVGASPGESGLPVQCSLHRPVLFPSRFSDPRAEKQHEGVAKDSQRG